MSVSIQEDSMPPTFPYSGHSSPLPHMYDTSTSESSTTLGYSQSQHKQTSVVAAAADATAAEAVNSSKKSKSNNKKDRTFSSSFINNNTSNDADMIMNRNTNTKMPSTMHQHYQHQQQPQEHSSATNNGTGGTGTNTSNASCSNSSTNDSNNNNFKSQAALLASTSGSAPSSPSRRPLQHPHHHQHPTHRLIPTTRNNSSSRNGIVSEAGTAAASDVSAPASFPSAAAHYMSQQQQQQQQQRGYRTSTTSSNNFESNMSNNNSSTAQPTTSATMTTQSEPGGGGGGHYSYHTLLSNARTATSTTNTSTTTSRFAALNHYNNSNRSKSRYELAAQRQMNQQQQQQQNYYPSSISEQQQQQQQQQWQQQPQQDDGGEGSDYQSQTPSQSQQPLLQSSDCNRSHQYEQQQTPSRHPSSSLDENNPVSSSSIYSSNNSKNRTQRGMSVLERIKRFSHLRQQSTGSIPSYPDPEIDLMNIDGREKDGNNIYSQSSSSYQPSSVRRLRSTGDTHNDKTTPGIGQTAAAAAAASPQQQQQQQHQSVTASKIMTSRRAQITSSSAKTEELKNRFRRHHGTRSEAALAVREAKLQGAHNIDMNDNQHNSHLTHSQSTLSPYSKDDDINNNSNTSPYLPTVASSSRPEHAVIGPPEDAHHQKQSRPRTTSLPPVRRRKPLQQPAYDPQQQQQQQELQEEETPAQQQQPAQQPPDMGSPSRIQDLKRQLWTADERLNVSLDLSNDSKTASDIGAGLHHRRTARSLSPGKQRQAINNSRSMNSAVGGISNNNVGGFKSKFYQAAMAAQRGDRATTPPRSRNNSYNNQDGGTPPRSSTAAGSQQRFANRSDYSAPSKPTGPQQQEALKVSSATPSTSHHRLSQARSNSVSPGRSRTHDISDNSMSIVRKSLQEPAVSNVDRHNLQQQHASEPTTEKREPPTWPQEPVGKASPPMTKEGKHYIAKLMAKLNAVSRDDPQAALAQIDYILRSESKNGGSPPEYANNHAMFMNAAAAAVGMPPLDQSNQQSNPYLQQGHQPLPGSPNYQHPYQQSSGQPNMPDQNAHGAKNGDAAADDDDDDDDDSDDETSVSSITNPTYRSEKPTHEQLHDLPPPKGISTALYRRPRPNGLQNYANPAPTPAISGLELVQRHHERQVARKGGRAAEHPHAYNHHQLHHANHHPPVVINVTASMDEDVNQNPTKVFTENLIKSSSNKKKQQQQQQQQHPTSSQKQQSRLEVPKHDQQKQEEQVRQKQQQQQEVIQRQLQHQGANGYPVQSSRSRCNQEQTQQHVVTPKETSHKLDSIPYRVNSSQDRNTQQAVAKSANKMPLNPFDDSVEIGDDELHLDRDRPRYSMASADKERKLDSFMSRKQRKEEEEFLRSMEDNDAAQLEGDALARKIRTWDELSSPASKVSTRSSADGSQKMGVSSHLSGAGSNSKAGSETKMASEISAVNVSTATLSLGATSAVSKNSRRSHPWDGDIQSTKLKIDFRDTSMDNALGVEAECFSQSQASPARDLRKAARIQHQHQMQQLQEQEQKHRQSSRMQPPPELQQMRVLQQQHQFEMQQQIQETEEKERLRLENQISPARELRKERVAREAMERQAKMNPSSSFDNEGKGSNPGAELSQHKQMFSKSDQFKFEQGQDDQDGGFEVTAVYGDNLASHDYSDEWVAVPTNSYFDTSKKTTEPTSEVVATLVDEDTKPVTMVRSRPELPTAIADAFADVPVPFDEQQPNISGTITSTSNNLDWQQQLPPTNRKYGNDNIMDVSGIKEAPPPQSTTSATSSNRGRRAFSNFLKKKSKAAGGSIRKSSKSPSPRKPSLASAMEHYPSDRDYGASGLVAQHQPSTTTPTMPLSTRAQDSSSSNMNNDTNRGRMTAPSSTAPTRDRARSFDDTARIRNPNIAKKFSRLLKVYGNDISNNPNQGVDDQRGQF